MKKIDKRIKATFENAIFYENKIWFTELECNEFYCYDFFTQKTELICKFSQEIEYKSRLFYTIIPFKNYMYLTPFYASKIYKVNILNGEVKEINLLNFNNFNTKMKENYYEDAAKFMSAHFYKNIIYFLPASFPAIAELNCDTDEIRYYTDWIVRIKEKYVSSERSFFRKTLFLNGKIYMPLCKGNAVVIFDIDNKKFYIKEVGNIGCSYSSICYDGKDFWLSPRGKGAIVSWNEKTGKFQEYENFPNRYIKIHGGYGDIIYLNGEVFLIPMSSTTVLRVNIKNCIVEKYNLDGEDNGFMCQFKNDKSLFLFSAQSGFLYIISLSNMHIEKRSIYLPKNQEEYHKKYTSNFYRVIKKEKIINLNIFEEEYDDSLKDYFQWICKQNAELYNDKNSRIKINGNKILSEILNSM